jgi:hydroxymethylpyrimidine/phosphomethylpyrimidine kinase
MPTTPPVALSIAGSDPSGGAGVQADLKVFADHGVYGAAAITALTVQTRRGVLSVASVDQAVVAEQTAAVLVDLPVACIKIGMLGDGAVLRAVAGCLDPSRPVPVVLDPVLRSSSGAALLPSDAIRALVDELIPRCLLVTPNLPELSTLEAHCPALRSRCRDWGVSLLVKGGHGSGGILEDRLLLPDGSARVFRHQRIETDNLHGTGCVLSSAITAGLARGQALEAAVQDAITYLQGRIEAGAGWRLGAGVGPLPVGLGFWVPPRGSAGA